LLPSNQNAPIRFGRPEMNMANAGKPADWRFSTGSMLGIAQATKRKMGCPPLLEQIRAPKAAST
jgi:hypothetical protein